VNGAQAGGLIAAAGLAPLLVSGRQPLRAAGFAAWVVGVLIMAADLLHSPISELRVSASERPVLAAAAVVLGMAALMAAVAAVHRHPWLFVLAAVAAAPARVPFHVGGEEANLLVPLYAVLMVGSVVTAWELLRGVRRQPALGWIGMAAAAFVAFNALSLLWGADVHAGAVSLLFYYLPFGMLLARVGLLRLDAPRLRWAFAVQLALAAVFVAVAYWQEATHRIFWNPTIDVSNQYSSFFRVNSLFWDASVYGRFIAVTLVLCAGVVVYHRAHPALIPLMALLFGGMYFSYSQSSMLALAAGALVLGATVWPHRLTIGLAAGALALGLAALAIALGSHSATSVSSDRSHLVSLGWRVIKREPWHGAGLGGLPREALKGTAHPGRVAGAVSHTTPVTVAAELGPLGVALYLWLLWSIVAAALAPGARRELRLTLLATMAAIFTSSLFYNDFFEDPSVWILMGLIATAALMERPAAGARG
jgi:hypothetical protein